MTRSSAPFVLALVWVLAGCFAKGTPFSQYDPIFEGEGRLYVYRPGSFVNSGGAIDFILNGKELSRIRNDGYVSVSLKPGTYMLVAEFAMNMRGLDSVRHDFKIEAGRAMYCGYFSGTDTVYITWQLNCSEDRGEHFLLQECKREPFEPNMGWLP